MELGLKGKVAFVAASSQGLGKSVALELAKEGAQLVICGRNPETLEATQKEIQKYGNVLSIVGDLSVEADINRMIKSVTEKYDSVDILVTNTGGPPSGRFEDLSQEQWDQTYQQLLVSATRLIRGFLPGMKKSIGDEFSPSLLKQLNSR